jgi:hypothetical protein
MYESCSRIDFIVNGTNVLWFRDRPWAYPTFAFVINLKKSAITLLAEGRALIPVYTMAWATQPGDRCYTILIERSFGQIEDGCVSCPVYPAGNENYETLGMPTLKDEPVVVSQFVKEVIRIAKVYKERVGEIATELRMDRAVFCELQYEDLVDAQRVHLG